MYGKEAVILIKSSKKLINKTVYDNKAEYPWAKVKDFILSADGKRIEKVVLVSESLIPVPYTVLIEDFEKIEDKSAVLKPDIKPEVYRKNADDLHVLSNLKKRKFENDGKKSRIFDVSFDAEIGEIVDFIIIPSPIGRKSYISSGDKEINKFISQCF